MAKATKTGNVDNIINTNRSRLEITGFKSFVPSPRNVLRATAKILVHFTDFCKPEKIFSGLRSDLVSCVKAVVFLSLKTTELHAWITLGGLRLDIWRDSWCEIGGVEVTRLAFRLLYVNISVQSTSSVLCFAVKSILFWKSISMIISLGIAYMLYIVGLVNCICSLTKLNTLAPSSTIFQKIIFVKWSRAQDISAYGQKPVRNLRANS